jgi:ankyrin repeat protein
LAEAVIADDAAAVRRILAADPALARAHHRDGWSMLHLASSSKVAALLLAAGADINARNQHPVLGPGNRPLHAAVYNVHPALVDYLLDRGADVNATDNAGWAPLHIAVANGRVELAKRLLQRGADPNARLGVVDGQAWSGRTALGLLAVEDRTGEGVAQVAPEVDEELRRLLQHHRAVE